MVVGRTHLIVQNVNHSGLREVIPSLANWLQPKYGIKKITGPRINKKLSAGPFRHVTADGLRGSIPLLVSKTNIMSRTVKQIYRKSRAFDRSCRNNGSCSYCRENRLHKHNKKLIAYSLNTTEE
jgi:hypothetical protein